MNSIKLKSLLIPLGLTLVSSFGILLVIVGYNLISLTTYNIFIGLLIELIAIYGLYLFSGLSRCERRGYYIDKDSVYAFVFGVPVAIFIERIISNIFIINSNVIVSFFILVAILSIAQNYIEIYIKKYDFFKIISKWLTYFFVLICFFL